MSVEHYQILDWDSQWFGFPIGRADITELTVVATARVDAWAEKLGLRCVYIFAKNGFQAEAIETEVLPIDIRVEYELDPTTLAHGSVEVKGLMRPEEKEAVCAIARRLFPETRFSRDLKLPFLRVRELYAEWVRIDSERGLPGCLVIRNHDEIIGFVTGRTDQINATRGSIGLLGVVETYRGRGIGANLLDHVCRAFFHLGVKRVTVVTQEANAAACHLYKSRGRVVARGYWYHRWYDDNHRGTWQSLRPGSVEY